MHLPQADWDKQRLLDVNSDDIQFADNAAPLAEGTSNVQVWGCALPVQDGGVCYDGRDGLQRTAGKHAKRPRTVPPGADAGLDKCSKDQYSFN